MISGPNTRAPDALALRVGDAPRAESRRTAKKVARRHPVSLYGLTFSLPLLIW